MNFSRSVDFYQLKGRPYEAMHSNCLLLEEAGSQASLLFEPNKDYIEFSSPSELMDQLVFFCSTNKGKAMASKISNNAYNKLITKYNMY